MELNEIYAPVQEDLYRVRDTLRSISNIDFSWLAEQLGYIVKGTGKAIRPALTLLSGMPYKYNLTYLMPMAVSVELMHTATLVHDDVIDKSASESVIFHKQKHYILMNATFYRNQRIAAKLSIIQCLTV